MNRKFSFKVLVGSHNYNLQTETSDRDYKVFFYPNFSELYSGEKYSKAVTSNSEDIEYHDIRKLPDMLWKSNVNFLEVLFSTEVHKNDDLYDELWSKREDIARMNLPYLYDACMGMFYKKKKEFERDLNNGSEWSKVCKHVMSAVKIVDFLQRYESNNWNFQDAINYKNNEFKRSVLLSIRKGEYKYEDELRVFMDSSEKLLNAMKNVYKKHKEDLETKKFVYETVKEYVAESIFQELI
jgi:predicted nucleotidyltransferase